MTPQPHRSFADLASLKGRVALITGGAGEIGRAIADAYAELGAAVVVLDAPGSAAEQVARRLTDKYGVLATAMTVDLLDEVAVRKVPQRVVDTCGRLDIIVNNVAADDRNAAAPVEDQNVEAWRRDLDITLTAPFLLTQQAIPALKASGKGSVINIGPAFGSAAKGGLLAMTRWLATTLAPTVRVNAIVPGEIERDTQASKNHSASRLLLARAAREEDFKGAAVFLASDLSAYVTGQCLKVDGGWSAA